MNKRKSLTASIIFFLRMTAFVPVYAQIPTQNLAVWLRSDTGIVLDGNGNVQQWIDQSGSGHDAYQAGVNQRPFFNAPIPAINNKPSLSLDGIDDYLRIDTLTLNTYITLFAFGRYNNNSLWFEHSANTNSYDGFYFYGNGSAAWFCRRSPDVFAANGQPGWVGSNYCIATLVYDTAQGRYYRNGVIQSNAGFGGTNPLTDIPLQDNFFIGSRNGGGPLTNGEYAEIIIYNTPLSDSLRTAVDDYIKNKYAPPVNLGPDITVSGICNYTLDAGARFTSFMWNGNPADTSQTFTLSGAGDYWVQAVNIFGDVSSDTIHVNFLFNQLATDTIMCLGDSIIWNTNLPDSDFGFYWSSTADTTLSQIALTQAGDYYVTIREDSTGCLLTSDTVHVTVDSFSQVASLGADSDSLCAGNVLQLVAGAAEAISYQWHPGGETTATLPVNTSGFYSLDVTDTNGCTAQDTVYIFISGIAPISNFTSPAVCEGSFMLFTDASTPPSGDTIVSWFWNFGDPSSGSSDTAYIPTPSHLYADSGSYSVTLRVTTNTGCYKDTVITVHVYPNPSASFMLPNNSCEDSPTLFFNNSNTYNYPVQSYAWNFGDPGSGGNNFSSDTNGVHTYSSPGVYMITLTVTNIHGCSATVSMPDTVKPSANPQFQALTNCFGEPMQFNNFTQPGSFQTIFWDFGDNSGSPSPATTIYHLYAYEDTFNVTLSATTAQGCISSLTVPVIVNPLPVANFLTTPACENSPYAFTDASTITSGAVTAWQWTFPNSSSSTSQNPAYVFPDAQTYPVTLVAISQSNCKDTITQNILVHSQPVADFGLSLSYGDAPLTENFGNLSSGAVSYLWDFGDNSGTSSAFAPSHTYTARGTYTVTLIATSSDGCSDTTIRYVYVLKPILDIGVTNVYVSNAGNYISVSARVRNFGNLEVLNYKISATLENRLPVFENWTGNLAPTLAVDYPFNAHFEISPGNPPQYVCVEATSPNNTLDENPSNNLLCVNLSDEFIVVDPYPNPSADLLNLVVIAPHKERLSIDVFDAGGKLVSNVFNGNVTTGMNQFIFDTSVLNEGVYFCRFSFLTKTIVKPLTHIAKDK